ncbi:GNAT family N-acetyltransferase [Massilia sp. CF038]|uniref:GNAT family N-acetyltransferase n=1 Tax=Massilia sp. CF038 TaxID=1881045 RepID=UPI0022770B59|nr:GNAT family protein [Massilia sp. CF038]
MALVPVSLSHANALSTLVQENQAHLKTYMPRLCTLNTPEAAQHHLRQAIDSAAKDELCEWHIFSGDQLCGAVRIHQFEPHNRKAAIAYYIGAGQQGGGLATKSARAVLAYCFRRLDLNRIELRCAADNLASQRVAKRLGFTWEGMLRQAELNNGVFIDHFIYSLLRQDANALLQSA